MLVNHLHLNKFPADSKSNGNKEHNWFDHDIEPNFLQVPILPDFSVPFNIYLMYI